MFIYNNEFLYIIINFFIYNNELYIIMKIQNWEKKLNNSILLFIFFS